MKIYIGADHGGFHLRQQLIDYLSKHYEVEDEGNTLLDPDDDYPQFAARVTARMLASDDKDPRGILVCKGAQGMGMAANRVKGIRAAVVWDNVEAKMTRNDNDSNVLCLSARLFDGKADRWQPVVNAWLNTPFSGAPRHMRRIKEMDEV